MQESMIVLALLSAGLSLAMGAISFYIGWREKDNTNLFFGFMALCLVVFVIIPPIGFIQPTDPEYHLLKRFFIFSYYLLLPWFIISYTRLNKPIYAFLIDGWVVFTFVVLIISKSASQPSYWTSMALIGFGANLMLGIVSGIRQYRLVDRTKAVWLLTAMAFYAILFLYTVQQQTELRHSEDVAFANPAMHIHALFLIFIMGLGITVEVLEKYRLEKALQASRKHWQSFMDHAPILVLQLNGEGNISFMNDFGVHLLGYNSTAELQGHNWCGRFLSPRDAEKFKSLFDGMIREEKPSACHRSTIRDKYGEELVISWISFPVHSDDNRILSIMNLGSNITQAESAHQLIHQLRLELEKEKIPAAEEQLQEQGEIIGNSWAIRYAIEKARQVAKTTAPVLLEGETGVGKELIADLIHKISLRSDAPYVKVNCGSLPKELMEDELFGHEKGAFTSAVQARKGRFELADGGTIFLDEIGELPLEMQPKLLRVLQNGEFERIGSQRTIKVDVRVIAATNRDLSKEVHQGHFRSDLFYRLCVFPITVPALSKRVEDIPLLVSYFVDKESTKYNKKFDQISKADLQRLIEHPWPGNVRELKNLIDRSVIISEGRTLRLEWFFDLQHEKAGFNSLADVERQHILKVMESCQWKINGVNGAAEKLNMHPNTLRFKMKKLQITRPVKDMS
jgi:formate hydrogenlyase transcriptional activator